LGIKKRQSLTGEYVDIYDVDCPVTFFFAKDGFDGIEIDVSKATAKEQEIAAELCKNLAERLNRKFVRAEARRANVGVR